MTTDIQKTALDKLGGEWIPYSPTRQSGPTQMMTNIMPPIKLTIREKDAVKSWFMEQGLSEGSPERPSGTMYSAPHIGLGQFLILEGDFEVQVLKDDVGKKLRRAERLTFSSTGQETVQVMITVNIDDFRRLQKENPRELWFALRSTRPSALPRAPALN